MRHAINFWRGTRHFCLRRLSGFIASRETLNFPFDIYSNYTQNGPFMKGMNYGSLFDTLEDFTSVFDHRVY